MNKTSNYDQLAKLDDLAFRLLQLAISPQDQAEFCDRIAVDYLQDLGMMGFLRRAHVESDSVAKIGHLYWGSRREPASPRLESLIGTLLMNIASSVLYDALKEMALNPHVRALILDRGLDIVQLPLAGIDVQSAWRDLASLWQMREWRQEDRIEEAASAIKIVLEGGELTVHIEAKTQKAVDILKVNVEMISRGLVAREVERDTSVKLPANGRRYEGAAASPGLGRGRVEKWPAPGARWPEGVFVLLIPQEADAASFDLPLLIARAAAVVTNGGMTGHAAVSARGARRPAVIVSSTLLRDFEAYDELIVDGSAGLVLGRFHEN